MKREPLTYQQYWERGFDRLASIAQILIFVGVVIWTILAPAYKEVPPPVPIGTHPDTHPDTYIRSPVMTPEGDEIVPVRKINILANASRFLLIFVPHFIYILIGEIHKPWYW